MKKISLMEVKELMRENLYYWAQDKMFIATYNKTIIINNFSEDKYALICNETKDQLDDEVVRDSKNRPLNLGIHKEPWQKWEIDLIRKYSGNYNVLKAVLPHRTRVAIRNKSSRLGCSDT